MPVRGSRLIDRTAKVELRNDGVRAQIKVLPNQFSYFRIRDFTGTEGLDLNGDRMRDTDHICQLDFAFRRNTRGDDIFGDVSGGVGG